MRKQPQRTCIGCRQVFTKRELVRLVRTPNGEILVDPTGKAAGRGAYLCRNRGCWLAALKGNRIEQALHTPLSAEDRAQIEAYAAQLGDVKS